MTKSREIIAEAVENPKHTFGKAEGHPKKTRKHRHERRKMKEYLNLGDWLESQNPN
jgi:UDP-2,3-diacylglucosamine pyrophosphatase LpxH